MATEQLPATSPCHAGPIRLVSCFPLRLTTGLSSDPALVGCLSEVGLSWLEEADEEFPVDADIADHPDFRSLGTADRNCLFLTGRTSELVSFTAGQLTESSLLTLQSLYLWQDAYPQADHAKHGFNITKARADLVAACQKAGIFDRTRLRGCGVWRLADGRIAVHAGDQVIVDGAACLPKDVEANEVFPGYPRLFDDLTAEPLPVGEGRAVLDALASASWSHPLQRRLVAGWLVLAPLCGCLPWRPHLWLTGPRAAGKSWLLDRVLGPLLRPVAIRVDGGTTAAGIRQLLRDAARPVLFDEAEAHTKAGIERIEGLIELGRYMSSSQGGQVLKGTAGHQAVAFTGVSQFLLASINIPLARAADATRWTVIELRPRQPLTDQQRSAVEVALAAIAAPFPARLLATTLKHLPVLLANQQTYARAIAQATCDDRLGDQYGGLLAGERLLHSHDEISPAMADEEVRALPLDLLRGELVDRDEDQLWNRIFSQLVQVGSGRQQRTWPLGEVVRMAFGIVPAGSFDQRTLRKALQAQGLDICPLPKGAARDPSGDHRAIFLMNHPPRLLAQLQGTEHAHGLQRVLRRREGVEDWPTPKKLPGLSPSRGLLLRRPLFMDESEP